MSKTVKIRNVSPYGDLDVPSLRRVVKHGEVIELDSETAATFLLHEDNWHEVGASRTKSTTTDSDS